ncbi:MAG: glycosyltransferase [Syntrophobacteraceae bacterium]
MKLLYITVSMPFGHGEAFFIPEVQELLRKGHELLIVPRSPKGTIANKDAAGLDQHSHCVPLLSRSMLLEAAVEFVRQPLIAIQAVVQIFKSRNFPILGKNLVVLPKSFWLARKARGLGVDHIVAQWGSTPATMAMLASELSGIPWSFVVHRWDIIDDNLLELKAGKSRFMRFISEDGYLLAQDICGKSFNGNGVILHLGVRMPDISPGPRQIQSPPRLLCPAHLIERKGQEYLIRAIALLRQRGYNTRLQLAGDGEMRGSLEALVCRYGLQDAVEFLGQVQHGALLQFYETGKVDMIVLPTLHEGIPVSLMEAMSYGIPCVSTTTGGIPELLRDGAGVLVPPKDPTALADAIEKLLQDHQLRDRTAKNGYRRVKEEFNVEKVAEDLISLMSISGNAQR